MPTPAGAAAVVKFVQSIVDECGGGVGIDWHGHRDRDLAIENSLAAMRAGATRLHGAAIGIGERVGNTPMDALLVNLVLMGVRQANLTKLGDYCAATSEATGVPIPANYPVIGRDAYRTATGVHAAAVIKAFKKNDAALADAVYSGVPASLVGREQGIEVGPMSGKSNVVYWLEEARPGGDRRARGPDLRQGEGGRLSAGGRRYPQAALRAEQLYLPGCFSIAGNEASSTSPTICRLRAETLVRSSQQAASLCHSG
jgi:isopropylmalate/homocitrate/citramalate synthase